jgi:hypothetical protein
MYDARLVAVRMDHVDDRDSSAIRGYQSTGIIGLAAGRCVEDRLVEHDAALRRDLGHSDVKRLQIAV